MACSTAVVGCCFLPPDDARLFIWSASRQRSITCSTSAFGWSSSIQLRRREDPPRLHESATMCPRLETRGAFALLFFPAFLRDACFAASSTAPSPLLGRCFSLFPAVRGRACVDGGALAARRCGIAVPKAGQSVDLAAGRGLERSQATARAAAQINRVDRGRYQPDVIVMQAHAAPRRPVKLAHC